MKILVVGQSPAKGWEDYEPFVGLDAAGQMCKSGQTWVDWCTALELDWRECEYRNVFDASGEFQPWLKNFRETTRPTIALGSLAARRMRYQLFLLQLPHPSGRNRVLNDKKALERRLKEAARVIKIWKESIK